MKKTFNFAAAIMVAFGLLIYLSVSHAYAQSSYDVNKSVDTVHVPVQPKEKPKLKPKPKPKPKPKTKILMAPTWPIKVPVRVPIDTPVPPGYLDLTP